MKFNKLVKIIAATVISVGIVSTVSSCADGSALRTGPVLAPSQASKVQVLTEKPKSKYVTLGLVESEMEKGLFSSKTTTANKALEELKNQAAALGANAVIIKNYSSTTNNVAILDSNDSVGFPLDIKTKRLTGTAILLK